MKAKDLCIHPEDRSSIQYWTRKWGVTPKQLNDAILQTGSLRRNDLKAYLKKEIWYYAPFFGLLRLLKISV